jgi:flagellar motility protein MotE (MotC chaperone)
VEFEAIAALRSRHPAWRLLRAQNAPLILAFLGNFFVEGNRGACAAGEVATALDDAIYAINALSPVDAPDGSDVLAGSNRYLKKPTEYLEDWAAGDAGFLRRFYPPGDDEVHYEATPAFEKAYAWVSSLQARSFVGTESRLHTVVELLRQIVHGTETDPEARLADLRRRRDEIEAEIASVEAGRMTMLDPTGVRDRYQQFSTTARELLADFREVEENFRLLDRAAREKIAAWAGSKGDLLADLVGSRSEISGSDQGRSFQAFYDYLLSQSRQDELTELLRQVAALDSVHQDERMHGIHHYWSEAAERAQRTVRQISEQLRRFLDDQVWLENRRVIDLVRSIEAAALEVRDHPPHAGLHVDAVGIDIALPFERPLYRRSETPAVQSLIPPTEGEADADLLFAQSFVDLARLAGNIRSVLPKRSSARLEDIVALYPIEQGAAEIVGYLALNDEELTVDINGAVDRENGGAAVGPDETELNYRDPADPDLHLVARLPKVTVRRR